MRILLVDDHPVVRRGLAACLTQFPNIEIVGEASDGQEALRQARQILPDVVLMDNEMPQMSGLATAEVLRKELPQVKVLILSMHRNTDWVMRTIESGVRGYVLKDAGLEELRRAIESVGRGEVFFSAAVTEVAFNKFVQRNGRVEDTGREITNREREVLITVAEGLCNKEIACRLGVSVRTVETHREHIMKKLNIHSVAGLTQYAISAGLTKLGKTETSAAL